MIILSVTSRIKKEKVAEVHELFCSFVKRARAEPGCISYELFQGIDDKQVFHFFEKWADQPSLDVHNEQPYIKDFLSRANTLWEHPSTLLFLKQS